MGTRADFYVGRGKNAEWIGSIAWDGHPGSIDQNIFAAASEEGYRERVAAFLASRDDGTTPDQGWPWPWEDSHTTDYAYAFDPTRRTTLATWGDHWFLATDDEETPLAGSVEFPDMSARKSVIFGKRSGVISIEPR